MYQSKKKGKPCFRCDSTYLGWFEGVVCWKMNCQEENTSLIWTVALKARMTFTYFRKRHDVNPPVHSFPIIKSNFNLYLMNTFKAAGSATSVTNFNIMLL